MQQSNSSRQETALLAPSHRTFVVIKPKDSKRSFATDFELLPPLALAFFLITIVDTKVQLIVGA